jgi:hypothetical protein
LGGKVEPVSEAAQPAGSLGEHLVRVLRGVGRHGEHVADEDDRNGVEQPAHAVDEHLPGREPRVRLRERGGVVVIPNLGPHVRVSPSC